jgi:hypothetical protein
MKRVDVFIVDKTTLNLLFFTDSDRVTAESFVDSAALVQASGIVSD